MKLMGGRTVSAKVRLQRQLVTEVTGACRRTLGRHGRYGAAIPTSLARHREWYKYMVPPPPPDENDWPEDHVWRSETSDRTCHEGQRGLNKLGKAGLCVATVTTLLTRHREWHKYIIPLARPDEIYWPEDRVCKKEASETGGHGGQWGLNKLGKAGICGAAVATLLTRHRERHKYIIPLPLLDEIDGPEDRVCKCEASETAGRGGQRGLPKETGQTRQIWGRRHNIAGQTPRVVQVQGPTTASERKRLAAGPCLGKHRERLKYIIPLLLPDNIDGREDRVCKVRLQRQLDTEVSGACRRTLGRHGRYGAAIPTSLARRHESGTSTWSDHCHQMKTIDWRAVSRKVRLQRQLVMKVSGA
ncbi:hypothetical protein MRX96_001573 [Rhipicephalus microplus]